MEPLLLLAAFVIAVWLARHTRQQQRQRTALLATFLQPYPVERLMQTLVEGYLRAMGESDAERRTQILNMLQSSEVQLCSLLARLATDLQHMSAPQAALARVSLLPVELPGMPQLLPSASFDFRHAILLHASGITRVVENTAGLSPRDRGYMLTAEILLMQHTCHWFCKSWVVACARAVALHQTPYKQILASVSPETRTKYRALTRRR